MILLAGFLAWMFAGLENSLFILVHRQMMLDLLGSSTAETLITEWFAWFQAAFLCGAAVGGWLFGWLGDRMGRTRALGLSVLCYSALTLVCYWVHDAQLMWALRFLACLGFGGTWPNAVALVSEAWPSASRPLLAGIMGTAANFGFVLLGLIGYAFPITGDQWRWVLLVGASPLILAGWILWQVPESARWLAAYRESKDKAKAGQSPLVEVFRPPLVTRTLIGIALGAIPVVGTAANANWVVPWRDQFESRRALPDASAATTQIDNAASTAATPKANTTPRKGDPRQKAKTQIIRSSGAIFGSLLGGFIASIVGRRLTYFLISLCTFATSSWLFSQLTPDHPYFDAFVFLLGFFGVTYFGWLPLFLPELFPTHVRSTGAGISFNTGRLLAAIVVLVAALRIDLFAGDYAQVGFWSGMIYVLGMIIIWFAPRTELKAA